MPLLSLPSMHPGVLASREQPTLTVDELVLRPWRAEDAPAVVAAYQDPDIQRWHVQSLTLDEARAWTHRWSTEWRADTGASWAVVDTGDALLARVGIQKLQLDEAHASVAYWVVPAARGRGVAGRALREVTRWAFADVGIHRLQLNHSTENTASCRVAEAAGYRAEGVLRDQGLHADGWHDMHVHSRLSDDA